MSQSHEDDETDLDWAAHLDESDWSDLDSPIHYSLTEKGKNATVGLDVADNPVSIQEAWEPQDNCSHAAKTSILVWMPAIGDAIQYHCKACNRHWFEEV
jgi:hypothetical protein